MVVRIPFTLKNVFGPCFRHISKTKEVIAAKRNSPILRYVVEEQFKVAHDHELPHPTLLHATGLRHLQINTIAISFVTLLLKFSEFSDFTPMILSISHRRHSDRVLISYNTGRPLTKLTPQRLHAWPLSVWTDISSVRFLWFLHSFCFVLSDRTLRETIGWVVPNQRGAKAVPIREVKVVPPC